MPGLVITILIDDIVSEVWGIDKKMLAEKKRDRPVVEARQAAIWWLRNNTKMPLALISRRYKLDHSTVIYACRNVESLAGCNRQYREKLEEVVKRMPVIDYGQTHNG